MGDAVVTFKRHLVVPLPPGEKNSISAFVFSVSRMFLGVWLPVVKVGLPHFPERVQLCLLALESEIVARITTAWCALCVVLAIAASTQCRTSLE